MPARFDPCEVKIVYVRCVGGEPCTTASLAPKVGPLGLSPKKVSEEITKATQEWKGFKVTVKLTVQNQKMRIDVTPCASSLIIKELDPTIPGSSRTEKEKNKHLGNLSMNQVLNVARQMRHRSSANKLEGTVKEVLGTCGCIGCTVEGQNPQDIIEKIRMGDIRIPNE